LVLHDGRITTELTGSDLTAGNISRASLSV
jgi:hypothetical protein